MNVCEITPTTRGVTNEAPLVLTDKGRTMVIVDEGPQIARKMDQRRIKIDVGH